MNAVDTDPSTRMQAVNSIGPNALLVGPMKSGTSWLYEYLKTRDDVTLPDGVKETYFFDQRFESKSVDWYLSHFQRPTVGERIVEVAPTYFRTPEAPARIHQLLGNVPIIVTLRDPADRAFSLFQHMKRYSFTRCDTFREVVESHPEVLQGSRYATCLTNWLETFGIDNVTILLMQDLKSNPLEFASQCCRGLGLSPPTSTDSFPDSVNVATVPRNYHLALLGRKVGDALRSVRLYWVVEAAKNAGLKQLFFGKPQAEGERNTLTTEDRRWFIGLLEDEIDRTEQITGHDLASWKK